MSAKLGACFSKWYAQRLEPFLFKKRRPKRLLQCKITPPQTSLQVASLQLGLGSVPLVARYDGYYRQFAHQSNRNKSWLDPAGIAMVCPLGRFISATDFDRQLKKLSGNFWREGQKAKKAGFVVRPFMATNYTPDLLCIRRSKKVRSFGIVLDAFTLRLSDLGGPPTAWCDWSTPAEPLYWDQYFGVFEPLEGYTQGEVVTNAKLLAYARVHRIGNTLRYAELMGHADYQRHGVMNLLHREILMQLLTRQDAWQIGIDYLTYGALEQGSDGLCFWKRKALFQPMRLQIS